MSIRSIFLSLLITGLFLSMQSMAQSLSSAPALLEPSGTQYFQNQYLANPAMAGIDSGLHINAAYRRQWTGIDGALVTKFMTADYALGNRVGLGVHVFNDVAGLLNRTRAALTYAYHMPLNDSRQLLHFGLSLGVNVQRINTKDLNGDAADPSVGGFNRRDNYFEAEFGMAYTDEHLNIQASLPNVRGLFTGNDQSVDEGGVFFTAASYRFITEGVVSGVEPKICYRGVKGFDNILDMGATVSFLDNAANVMVMYHTSKSVTAGIGVKIIRAIAVQMLYTTQTGDIRSYVDGTYEVGASINLFR